jgi:hypothetical protein
MAHSRSQVSGNRYERSSSLDTDHPFHGETDRLAKRFVALYPTMVYEAYHAHVFKMKWNSSMTHSSIHARSLFCLIG